MAGAIVEGSPTNPVPEAGNDTSRNLTGIREKALLLGFIARPVDALRITSDFEFGYNDQALRESIPGKCSPIRSMPITSRGRGRMWMARSRFMKTATTCRP